MSGNSTFVGWTPESGGRGTWSVIWSCLTTLLLAIWVCYHPDIHDSGTWKIIQRKHGSIDFWYNCFVAMCALILPEGYIFVATVQFFQARKLREQDKESFSMQQAFYIGMGGYRTVVPEKFRDCADYGLGKDNPETYLLLPDHIVWLLRKGYVRCEKEMDEESDGDSVSGKRRNSGESIVLAQLRKPSDVRGNEIRVRPECSDKQEGKGMTDTLVTIEDINQHWDEEQPRVMVKGNQLKQRGIDSTDALITIEDNNHPHGDEKLEASATMESGDQLRGKEQLQAGATTEDGNNQDGKDRRLAGTTSQSGSQYIGEEQPASSAIIQDGDQYRKKRLLRTTATLDRNHIHTATPNRDPMGQPSNVDKIPKLLSDREIELLLKSNGTAKFLLLFQCFWFIVGCISRTANALPLALFEVLTLSYVVCPFFAYLMWWKKPQNVQVYQVLDLDLSDEEWDELGGMNKFEGERGFKWLEKIDASCDESWPLEINERLESIGDIHGKEGSWMVLIGWWTSGGIHFLAWNSEFASTAEQMLWRVCSVIWVVAPILMIADSRIITFRQRHFTTPKIRILMGILGTILACACKVVILILALIAFRRAPSGIYNTSEISNYFLRVF